MSVNILTCELALVVCGAYTRLWRYFNIKDYIICGLAVAGGFAMSYGLLMLLGMRPRKILWGLFFIVAVLGILLFRYLFKRTFIDLTGVGYRENAKRTLIVGAGQAGRMILREIHNADFDDNNPSKNLLAVGFVDDDITKRRRHHKAGREDRRSAGARHNARDRAHLHRAQYTVDHRRDTLLRGGREAKDTQLLFKNRLRHQGYPVPQRAAFRKPIEFDRGRIRDFIKGKVCMITGGGGSIGSELVRQIAAYDPKQVIIVDIYENNAYDIQQELVLEYGSSLNLVTLISSVRDYDKMEMIFRQYHPELVFHAAAHKHVPLMETVPEEAVKNNIFGTFNVAKLAQDYGVRKFVMISTDKAVNPTNVMGATKRACEMIIQYMAQNSNQTDYVTTRFGNVLGSNGSVIPLFRRQIESGNPVTVTHPDIIRYFMTRSSSSTWAHPSRSRPSPRTLSACTARFPTRTFR